MSANTTWCLVRVAQERARLKRVGLVMVILAAAGLLIGGCGQPKAGTPVMPGWVVVQRSATGDDTTVIQAAIDSLAGTGGVVFFPPGTYRHTGLTGRAGVHLQGVHTQAVTLDYTPADGDGIVLSANPNFFRMSDLTLESSAKSSGWGIRAPVVAAASPARQVSLYRVNVAGFLKGIFIPNAINCRIDQCHINSHGRDVPGGIGIQIGDERLGGNGFTVQDCYIINVQKGVVTYAQATTILRPILELCAVGVETHGTTTVLHPWVTTTNHLDFDIQPNKAAKASTGVLLVGYGSGGSRVNYASDTERRRTIIIPERLDFGPGKNPNDPRGIKLGSAIIYNDGSLQLENLRHAPPGVAAGHLAVVDGTLRIFDGTRWGMVGSSPPSPNSSAGRPRPMSSNPQF